MKELRRRAALARRLWTASKRGRRKVALYHRVGDASPLAVGLVHGIGPRAINVGSARVRWSEVERVEASPPARCANCLREHGPLEACLSGVIAGVVVDRGMAWISPEQLARVNVDELWDRYGGPAADWLEDHLREMEVNREV